MKHKAMLKLFERFDTNESGNLAQMYRKLTLSHQKATSRKENNIYIIDEDYSDNAYHIERFAMFIEKTKTLPFIKKKSGEYEIANSKMKWLSNQMRFIKQWMYARDFTLAYSPRVEMFFEVVLSCGYPYEYSDIPINMACVCNMTMADFGNHLVTAIIKALESTAFKKKLVRQKENSFRQFSSSVNYVQYLLQRHSRLLHIRVDLSYDRKQLESKESELEYILKRFAQFRKIMSRKTHPFDYLDGYIAHVEYGRKKGHHIHMSLFYYGQKKMKDRYIANQIRLVWERVTDGIGLFQS